MTIPYNSSAWSMKKYLADSLVRVDCKDEDTYWYSTSESNKLIINDRYLFLLISCLKFIINNDF